MSTPATTANAETQKEDAFNEMLEVLKEADRLLGYFHWDSASGRTDKFKMVQKIRAAITRAERVN